MTDIADLPDLIVPTRDAVAQKFGRDWAYWQWLADPTRPVDVGPKSMPSILGKVVADILTPVFANVVTIGRGTLEAYATGDRLTAIGEAKGVYRQPATGATGYAKIAAASSGGVIVEDDELIDPTTSLRFHVLVTALYTNGQQVPIQAIDTGPGGNLAAGSVLTFTNPRPGIGAKAIILADNQGDGLSGGQDADTDAEYLDRIVERQTNPPASGNAAEYIEAVENAPGVPVEKAWVYPAWAGPGTTCVAFTVRPDGSGNRCPNDVQRGQVQANLEALFPGDDSITVATILTNALPIAISVSWKKGVPGWADAVPWPPFATDLTGTRPVYAPVEVARGGPGVAPTASSLRAETSVPIPGPQPGQTIALFNLQANAFQRKKIRSVAPASASSWDFQFDLANNASDLFVPVPGQRLSPWSDSLNQLPQALTTYMAGFGPGEQRASFPDPGTRQKRQPESPTDWPSILRNSDLVTAIKATPPVSDVTLLLPSTTPHPALVGVPGVCVYLLTLSDFCIFAESS